MITIVDYQMGNLRSVQKAIERVGGEARISSDPTEIATATKLVLPGVGAFGDAMAEIRRRDLAGPIRDFIASGRPFLGICLGLQLLFERGFEHGEHEGLGVLEGEVVRFELPPSFKVPHMGWNTVLKKTRRSDSCRHGRWESLLLRPLVLRPPQRSIDRRAGVQLRHRFLCHGLERQSLCHAIPSGKEPEQWTELAARISWPSIENRGFRLVAKMDQRVLCNRDGRRSTSSRVPTARRSFRAPNPARSSRGCSQCGRGRQ